MNFARLRFAPPSSPAWDCRLEEIGAAAIAIAYAARPDPAEYQNGAAGYWSTLSAGVRGAWFVIAFRAVTGGPVP